MILLAATLTSVTLIVRGIVRPLALMTTAMQSLARKDLTVSIEGAGRGDEIGSMATAVQVFKDNMIRNEQMAEGQRCEQEAKARRQAFVEERARTFNASVSDVLQGVTAASNELHSTAQSMSATAEETSRQASSASASAADGASANVQTAASAAEELSASIGEISRQVTQSAQIANAAVDEVGRTNTIVQSLAESADRIGEVVKLINTIAAQTNLLALNATIEAARASDAGKDLP